MTICEKYTRTTRSSAGVAGILRADGETPAPGLLVLLEEREVHEQRRATQRVRETQAGRPDSLCGLPRGTADQNANLASNLARQDRLPKRTTKLDDLPPPLPMHARQIFKIVLVR